MYLLPVYNTHKIFGCIGCPNTIIQEKFELQKYKCQEGQAFTSIHKIAIYREIFALQHQKNLLTCNSLNLGSHSAGLKY